MSTPVPHPEDIRKLQKAFSLVFLDLCIGTLISLSFSCITQCCEQPGTAQRRCQPSNDIRKAQPVRGVRKSTCRCI